MVIGHFRVLLCLCFKTSAKPFIWTWVLQTVLFSCKSKSFSYQWFHTWTCFETEAQGNSEMGYWVLGEPASECKTIFAHRLALKQRQKGTQRWLIGCLGNQLKTILRRCPGSSGRAPSVNEPLETHLFTVLARHLIWVNIRYQYHFIYGAHFWQ